MNVLRNLRKCLLFSFVIMPLYADNAHAEGISITKNTVAQYIERISRLQNTETQFRFRRTPVEDRQRIARDTLEFLGKNPVPERLPGTSAFRAYEMRLSFLVEEERTRGMEIARELMHEEDWAVEAIFTSLRLHNDSPRSVAWLSQYNTILADILPMSNMRRRADTGLMEKPGDTVRLAVTGLRPIPAISRHRMLEIASKWDEMEFYEEAAIAYREAIYRNAKLLLDRLELWDGVLSVNNAENWLRTARCHWRVGKHAEAFESLAKGMIFGGREHFSEGRHLAKQFAAEYEDGITPYVQPDYPDPMKLQEIIDLYREMNAHPRVFWLLEKYGNTFGKDFPDVWDKVAQEWLSRVELRLRQFMDLDQVKVYYFGYNVVPEENRLKVRVPPGFSSEALDEAASATESLLDSAEKMPQERVGEE